jgi:hypothetical protein
MFTLPEVAFFHKEGLLFEPVANAFESFCRTAFADQLRHGRQQTIRVPSLLDESRALNIQHFEGENCIRNIISEMDSWSKTALPFFEGNV